MPAAPGSTQEKMFVEAKAKMFFESGSEVIFTHNTEGKVTGLKYYQMGNEFIFTKK